MFLYPSFFYVIPLAVMILLVLYVQSRRKRRYRISKLSANDLVTVTDSNHCLVRSRLKFGFVLVGFILLMVALSRPRLGFEWSQSKSYESSMLILLDISQSMLVEDLYPNRLERAKLLIREIVESNVSSKYGLLVFASTPFLQCPPTYDYLSFLDALESQEPSLMKTQGSDLAKALQMLPEVSKDQDQTTFLLVSDGEDHSLQLQNAISYLKREKIVVHTLCIGSRKGALIPDPKNPSSQSYFTDQDGKVVFSKANPIRMKSIAEALGGSFTQIESEDFSIRHLLRQLIEIRQLNETELKAEKIPVEHYQWPLLISFLLLALDTAMGTRKPTTEKV